MENQSLQSMHERDVMSNKNKEYCSFLLSLKQVSTGDLQTWIVAMRNVHTGNQQIFSNLDGLIQFLQTEFGSGVEQQEAGVSSTQEAKTFSIQ
jgi:hypothetical protein